MLTPLKPKTFPLHNPASKCSPWCLMWPICSTRVHSQIPLHYMGKMYSQSVQPLDHISQAFIVDPLNPPPQCRRGVSWGELFLAYVHSQMNPQTCTEFGTNRSIRLAAFPDLNLWPPKPPKMPPVVLRGGLYLAMSIPRRIRRDMYQIWCQSVEQFDSFRRHLNLWPPKTPQNAPWGIVGRLVFSLCPFPDESADVNQSWCQSVKPFDSFSRLLNVWPPKTPKMPPGILRGELHLAYVHSQTNPQTCTKFVANQFSCLTASQDFLICDPLKSPEVSRGELYLA